MLARAAFAGMIAGMLILSASAAERVLTVDPDRAHVADWNRFAENVYALHRKGLMGHDVREVVATGEYGGTVAAGLYYRDVAYTDAATGWLLSRVRSDRDHPERWHIVEAYVRDPDGRVLRDYIAMYLPWARRAPITTFITLHSYPGDLHAMRQFNASGERIYERCTGTLAGSKVDIELDWGKISSQAASLPGYRACFDGLQEDAGIYLTPQ